MTLIVPSRWENDAERRLICELVYIPVSVEREFLRITILAEQLLDPRLMFRHQRVVAPLIPEECGLAPQVSGNP